MKFGLLVSARDTPAELFISRYNWLFRWAMHLTRNQRSAAEDLIQDTYIRFSQANLRVEDIRDPEALLYTYLEYVHLAQIREVARHSFTGLAEAKLDELALGLPNGPDVDLIETQNVLRRIAAYVSWRKQTSKSASIVALRFFHGYLPEEIARIALVSRDAVHERLHKGRGEIRLHLIDSERLKKLQHGGPPELFPAKFAVSTDELLNELQGRLFSGQREGCLSTQQLAARYRNSSDVPIQRDLLAHIVSCRNCLAAVDQSVIKGQRPSGPAGGSRSSSGEGVVSIEMKRPSQDEAVQVLSAKDISNLIQRSERKQKEIFEHQPTSLIVAVNGEILASRNTGASVSGLKVEVSAQNLKFVEVLNEYGLSLLSWVIEATPPHGDPVVRRQTEFSMGRRLEVELQFSAQKLVIEVQYCDPTHADNSSVSFSQIKNLSGEDTEIFNSINVNHSGLFSFFENAFAQWSRLRLTPLTATVFICTAIAGAFIFFWPRHDRVMDPAEFLRNAAIAELRVSQSANAGIIVQQVKIQSRQGEVENYTYHDPLGKHHLKQQVLDQKKQRIRIQLGKAGIDWNAPLSVASFEEWQRRNHVKDQSVYRISDDLLSLKVDVDGNDLEQETITVRTTDFHPIKKTLEFRNEGTIEIAELNYAVVPWETINHDLFESDNTRLRPVSSPLPIVLQPRPQPSQEDLTLAELEVKIALHEAHADSTDRLTITRSSAEIDVTGLIEDEAQRTDLKHRLALIPHVSSNLVSAGDVPQHEPAFVPSPSVQVVSVTAEPSLLETFLLKEGKSREASSEIADRLFGAFTSLLRANRALSDLKLQFPNHDLSPNALNLYGRLAASWQHELEAALERESDAIKQTSIPISPEKQISQSSDMDAEIEANRRLLKELIGHPVSNGRDAPLVIEELAHSVHLLSEGAKERKAITFQTPTDSVFATKKP